MWTWSPRVEMRPLGSKLWQPKEAGPASSKGTWPGSRIHIEIPRSLTRLGWPIRSPGWARWPWTSNRSWDSAMIGGEPCFSHWTERDCQTALGKSDPQLWLRDVIRNGQSWADPLGLGWIPFGSSGSGYYLCCPVIGAPAWRADSNRSTDLSIYLSMGGSLTWGPLELDHWTYVEGFVFGKGRNSYD